MQREDKACLAPYSCCSSESPHMWVPRSLPDNLSPSDASITMAAPQLQEALHQLQQIIIRGTMKCPGHWQLICLWQFNISTREIKPCVASQAEVGRKCAMRMCARSPAGRGKLLRFCMLFTTCLFQNTEFSLLCSSAVTLYHIDVQMGNTRAISASPFESDTEAEWNCGLTASIQVMFLFLKWAVWDLLFAVWVRRCLREKVILCQFNK